MAGRPKPIEQHIALSVNGRTLGNRAIEINDIAQMQAPDVPAPPAHLKEHGVSEWNLIWSAGYWFRADQDYHLVSQICEIYDQLDQFREAIAQEGLIVTGYNGQMVANPLLKEQRTAEAQMTRNLSLLGFSPTDRARLKLTELKGATELKNLTNNGQNNAGGGANAHGYVEDEW